MTQYGLFNDEGCVEAGFYSTAGANAAIQERYSPEDELVVREICPDHDEQPRETCEECEDEDEDEDQEDDEEEDDDED